MAESGEFFARMSLSRRHRLILVSCFHETTPPYSPREGGGSAESGEFFDISACYKLIFFDARKAVKRSLNIEHFRVGGTVFSRIFVTYGC